MRGCATTCSRCSRHTARPRGFSPTSRAGQWRGGRRSIRTCATSLTPGLRLGVFEIERFVGAGGMGEVYKARDTRLDRPVAIKVLSPDAATDPRRRARFAYEARAIARLSHPRICALHDMGHQDGIDFLVMEYLEGETLAARLRKGPMPLDARPAHGHRDRRRTRRRTCAGHRPSRSEAGQHHADGGGAKLLDFGLARLPAPRGRSVSCDSAEHQRRDGGRDDRWHAAVHGARATRRQGSRCTNRHLRVRRGAVRDVHREESLRGEQSGEHHLCHPLGRPSGGGHASAARRRPHSIG